MTTLPFASYEEERLLDEPKAGSLSLLPLAERLAYVDDEYDLGNYVERTPEQTDYDAMRVAETTRHQVGRSARLPA
jgi:hypothetical protein